jgi:predicted RNA-binding Zn-ribbon protein involved in translation (DUF1610 family)
MITRELRAAAPLALLSLVLTACGGSAISGGAYPQEPLPATADGTMDALDRAENDLRLALGGSPMGAPAASSAPQAPGQAVAAAPPPPPAAPTPSVQAESTPRDERPSSVASGPTALSSDPCASACRALASMERATTHLCSLAGDADARCEGARTRVKNAGARVHAECPACSGG